MKQFAISITARVLAEQLDAFLAATAAHRRAAQQEPGCLRYEVLQAGNNPCLLVISAVYRSLDAFREHRLAPYTEDWKNTTDPLLAEPRTRVGGYLLFGIDPIVEEQTHPIVLRVTVRVVPEHLDAVLAATAEQVQASCQEPGCLRYEVLQAGDDPCLLVLFELYRSAEDFQQHRVAPHTERWKTATDPLLAEPRTRVGGDLLFED